MTQSQDVAEAQKAPSVVQTRTPLRIRLLVASVVALCALGLTLVYSSSAVYAGRNYHDPQHFLRAQSLWLAIGVLGLCVCRRLSLTRLMGQISWLWAATLTILTLVLLPGVGRFVGGARRWLSVGPLGCQPSELAKLMMVIIMSALFARVVARAGAQHGPRRTVPRIGTLLVPAAICQLPVVLILLEPDLGTAIVIELLLATMMFAAGLPLRVLFVCILAAMPVLYHLIVGTPFRLRRLLSYIDPWAFRSTVGYQVTEALISIGSGGLFGVGLGDGKQKLFFLPEAHTDFIFAILAEELGLVGVGVLLVGYLTFISSGMLVALHAKDVFARFLALGATALVGIPAVFNLSVATGMVPTKGLPLPFISYGGSNLMVTLSAVGVLLAVERHTDIVLSDDVRA